MPNKTKNPDQPGKDAQTNREQTQDDRMPQRRDHSAREDQEPIEPDRGEAQQVDREPDSRKDEEVDGEDIEDLEDEDLEDEQDEQDRGLIE
jgi:hypothetical protein